MKHRLIWLCIVQFVLGVVYCQLLDRPHKLTRVGFAIDFCTAVFGLLFCLTLCFDVFVLLWLAFGGMRL